MPKKGIEITFEYVNEWLSYDPQAGVLRWKKNAGSYGRIKTGTTAGTLDPSGYVKINLDHTPRYAHRLAWLLHYGEFPTHQIDHINMDRADNRINNLRKATNAQNSRNRGAQSNNKSTGVKGVRFIEKYGLYVVSITVDGIAHNRGCFRNIKDAAAEYERAAQELHREFHRL